MAIIKATPKQEKEQVRINIDKELYNTIKKYCDWAAVKKMDEFFEQAAEFVFSKDKEWLTANNQTEK